MQILRFPKYIIPSLIIASFMVSSFAFIPAKALAQNYGTINPGSSSGLGPEVTGTIVKSIPGCMGSITNLLKQAFSKITPEELKTKEEEATAAVTAVPVFSKPLDDRTAKIQDVTKETNDHQRADDLRKSCFNGIAINIAREFLHQNTTSIINWVNSGYAGSRYEGSPNFVQNQDSFFKNLAKEKINAFGLGIQDPIKYPYGKDFIAGVASDQTKTFEQTNKYSLDDITSQMNPDWVSHSPNPFLSDFNKGGWSAWLGMTQIPANNPVGFRIAAADDLSKKLTGTDVPVDEKVKGQIDQGNGFLGDERCADPVGVTRAQNNDALNGNGGTLCKQWESVTPGKLISEQLINATNSSTRQVEMSNDINAVLGSVVNAILGKFTSDLSQKGLTGLAGQNPNIDINNANYPSNPSSGTQFTTTTSWISQNPDFNLQTDLTQALIDEQRTYISKLGDYDRELDALNRTIYQLDYCMPGPHPGWENDSRDSLEITKEPALAEITDFEAWRTSSDAPSSTVAQDISNVVDQVLSRLVGMNLGFGYHSNIVNKGHAITFLNKTFDAYKATIDKYYTDGNRMPFTWRESIEKFNQVAGYKQIIENNKSEILLQKENITKLQTLKDGIENGTYTDFSPNGFAVKQFARISLHLVGGDDIANKNSLYEQAQEERNYVWNDLIKGPTGCEKELYDTWRFGGSYADLGVSGYAISNFRRPSYPFPILYDYNAYPIDALLPNSPTTPIPGIQFSTVDPTTNIPYANKQAFWNTGRSSFLNDIFQVREDNTAPSTVDSFKCTDLGITCASGAHMDAYTFENNVLRIY